MADERRGRQIRTNHINDMQGSVLCQCYNDWVCGKLKLIFVQGLGGDGEAEHMGTETYSNYAVLMGVKLLTPG